MKLLLIGTRLYWPVFFVGDLGSIIVLRGTDMPALAALTFAFTAGLSLFLVRENAKRYDVFFMNCRLSVVQLLLRLLFFNTVLLVQILILFYRFA